MKAKGDNGYKGVEYAVTNRGDGDWSWAFYPKKESGPSQKGAVKGTREQAEAVCKAAIDAWLGT